MLYSKTKKIVNILSFIKTPKSSAYKQVANNIEKQKLNENNHV